MDRTPHCTRCGGTGYVIARRVHLGRPGLCFDCDGLGTAEAQRVTREAARAERARLAAAAQEPPVHVASRRQLEQGDGLMTAEASELGFPVGGWPLRLRFEGLGNGRDLRPVTKRVDDEGDVLWVTYEQDGANGCRVRVFND